MPKITVSNISAFDFTVVDPTGISGIVISIPSQTTKSFSIPYDAYYRMTAYLKTIESNGIGSILVEQDDSVDP